jgi:hypothetical protein
MTMATMTPATDIATTDSAFADSADELMRLLREDSLAPLRLGDRTLLPIVQGGMGVGVSVHRLAGSVAALGGMGTISSVDLRRHHADLMERTRDLPAGEVATRCAKEAINAANLEALEREIRAARSVGRARPVGHQRDARGERVRPLGDARARMRNRRGGGGRGLAARSARTRAGPPGRRVWLVVTSALRGLPIWATRVSTSRT